MFGQSFNALARKRVLRSGAKGSQARYHNTMCNGMRWRLVAITAPGKFTGVRSGVVGVATVWARGAVPSIRFSVFSSEARAAQIDDPLGDIRRVPEWPLGRFIGR